MQTWPIYIAHTFIQRQLTRAGQVLLSIVLTASACAGGLADEAQQSATTPRFESSPEVCIELDGTVGDYTQAVIEGWLLRVPRDNPAILEMFADRDRTPYRDLLPWSGEFAGKYLTSLTQVMKLSGDRRLRKAGEKFVGELIELQADDGYLGPFPKEHRLTGTNAEGGRTWDAWGHYHAMMGLLLWYDATGDQNALNCAARIGDLFCDLFLDTGQKVSSTGSAEMNQAVVHSLALLYDRTGEKRYLQLANEIVADFAAPNAGNYFQAGLNGAEFYETRKPRWESLHPLMGLAALYWIEGNADYRKVFEHFWWSIAKLDRHNNGGFSSGEQAHGDPYHQGPIETCCTVAWMAMSVEMLKLTGDSRVADELELSTLNQALAMHDPSGRWCTYNTPMEGRRIPSTVDIAFQIRPGSEELNCCSVNAARTLGMIADWALMRDEEGLILNYYGPAVFTDSVDGTSVEITQVTEYPNDGLIKIKVDPSKPHTFQLQLRIPHWSSKTEVKVNGERVAATPGEYLKIERYWQAGDEIELRLDMSVRFWNGEKSYAGAASVYRGPLLLAYSEPSPSELRFSDHWGAFGHFRAAADADAWVEYEFNGDEVEWHGFLMDDAGRARVIIDGKQVATVDQYGPQRDTPFSWRKSGLGEGRHRLRIEVTGEKNSDSKGTWLNVQNIHSPVGMPKLTATEVSAGEPLPQAGPGFLILRARNAEGQTVDLQDYASVGIGKRPYITWLPISGVPATEFSRSNPLRTSALGHP